MKHFEAEYIVEANETEIAKGVVKGDEPCAVKDKAWECAYGAAKRHAVNGTIDGLYFQVLIEKDGEYFDSDELFAEIRGGQVVLA